jgi:hypothetical protein
MFVYVMSVAHIVYAALHSAGKAVVIDMML